MPRISREVNNSTLGGRLEQFRPIDDYGDELTDDKWAPLLDISPKQLGVILKNKANVTAPFLQKIADWLVSAGYCDADVRWWLVGGERPDPCPPAKKNQDPVTEDGDGIPDEPSRGGSHVKVYGTIITGFLGIGGVW